MSLLIPKLVAQLILPPGGLILLAVVGLVFWRKWWGRGLIGLALACFWLLSTEPVRDALTRPLEFQYPALKVADLPAGPIAIVLLGGGIYEKAPEYGGHDELGRYAMMRTLYAARIARATGLPVYATGGKSLAHETETEGAVMRRWLIYFGVAETGAHAEVAASNTWQNAVYIKNMLGKQGIHRIVLVTSAWHMPRSVWCFKQNGLDVIAAPTDYLTKRSAYDVRGYFPRWNVLAESGDALHEYLGLLWYRLRYG
ncbi:MAG: YdcF family protein [Mariprofundaceae bacterium]|nr:YdcF family protein [Mariprofundaceae bacterium]